MPKQYKHGEELRIFWRDQKRRYRANVKKRLAKEEQSKKQQNKQKITND